MALEIDFNLNFMQKESNSSLQLFQKGEIISIETKLSDFATTDG